MSETADPSGPRVMRRVDLSDDKLTAMQRGIIQEHNKVQYEIFRKARRGRTAAMGVTLLGMVGAIYGYTIYQMSGVDLASEIEHELLEEKSSGK